MNIKPGDTVMIWAPDLVGKEGSKVVPPWSGPYVVEQLLSKVCYRVRSEIGDALARVHPNRIRRISKEAVQTTDPKNGVFPDGLRLLEKITAVRESVCSKDGSTKRWFNVQLRGRASPRWTSVEELPEAIVRLFDERHGSREGSRPREATSTADDTEVASEEQSWDMWASLRLSCTIQGSLCPLGT